MSALRLVLAGGGDERDSLPLDEIFAGWVGTGRLLYLPTALVHPSNKIAGERWLRQAMAPLGITNIEAWMDLQGRMPEELFAFDAIYIGGGNTFFLLHQLRHHRLSEALVDFAEAGRPVYGGSAGAIILGYDIASCSHIDENIIGLTDWSGLDLALGAAIWCHYAPQDDNRILKYTRRTGVQSVAIGERSGVLREGDRLIAAGQEPVFLFTAQGKTEVAVGDEVKVVL